MARTVRSRRDAGRPGWFKEWVPDRRSAIRALLLIAAGGLAATISLRSSVAGVFEASRPATALAWHPTSSRAVSNMAARLHTAERNEDARRLALSALHRDLTSVAAVRTLGLVAEAEGRDREAARLLQLAGQLSRRDIPTQAWLLRTAVQRADYEGAIRHFDAAMRTSSRGAEQLTPLLAAATIDPRMMPPLAAALARNPDWKVPLMLRLAAEGPRPDHTVLLARYLDPRISAEQHVLRVLIDRLIVGRAFERAWAIYRRINPGTPADAIAGLRDGGFDGAPDYPPLDWLLIDEPELAALRQRRPDGGPGNALSLLANGRSGVVARQLVRLSPGSYALEYDAGALPVVTVERPVVSVRCVTAESAFYNLRPVQSGAGPYRIRGEFQIPANCPWQWVMVSAAGSEVTANPPWIARLAIRRRS